MISVLVVLLCLELRDVGFKVLGSALSKLCGPVELLNMMLEWLARMGVSENLGGGTLFWCP